MRRILAFGLAWLAAGVVASVVAWQGVGLIGDQVTDDRPAPLTAAQVEEALARSSGTSEATTTTTAGPGTTESGTSTTSAPAEEPITKVYALAGGSAAFRFSSEGVTLAWAAPTVGYTARNGPGDDGGWWVEFDGPGGKSRVDAWWDGGPQDQVRDDAADGDSSDDSDGA